MLLEQRGGLLVLIDPDWPNKILPDDHDFFDQIHADLARRAATDPASLIEQASELNVGPLVTLRTGLVEEDAEPLRGILQRFVPV